MRKYHLGLCLMLLLSLLLCACGGDTTEITTAYVSTEQTASVTEPVINTVDIVRDGKIIFNVVRDEDADAAECVVSQARSVMNQIKSLTGSTPKLLTDWARNVEDLDSSTYEILVGFTDYPETRQVMDTLQYGEGAVRLVGNKIVVFGFTDTALTHAATHLNNVLEKALSEDGKTITVMAEDLEYLNACDEQMSALPMYQGGTFLSWYKAGNTVDEIIIRDTNVEQYQAYLKKLEENGFTCYTTHQITDNHFATYTNDRYTLTVGYYDYESSVRVLIEPLAPAVGLESDNVYTPVTTSQITMIGLEFYSAGSYNSNGLSVLIRLTDGRFIIIDGGFNRAQHGAELMRHLKEQSSEYVKSTKEITVAAWIITHPHGDHDGLLLSRYNDFKDITVERVLANFLSEDELAKADISSAFGANWREYEGFQYTGDLMAARMLGATFYQVHVGQVFYFADLKMEVLFTVESYGPKICNALNTTSIVLRMEFGGETVYMSTGDATGDGMEICAKMYGDYLQSDIVQVCHHGYSTWGNNVGVMQAYRLINAATVLWPQGTNAFPNFENAEYNAVLFKVSNYKEIFVAGSEGNSVTLPIPYTPGTGVVHRKNG